MMTAEIGRGVVMVGRERVGGMGEVGGVGGVGGQVGGQVGGDRVWGSCGSWVWWQSWCENPGVWLMGGQMAVKEVANLF